MTTLDQSRVNFDNYFLLKNDSFQTRTSYLWKLRDFDEFRRSEGIGGRYGQLPTYCLPTVGGAGKFIDA